MRITVRDVARVGEIGDAATRAGAVMAALDAAGKDARAKAETLAAAAGRQLGEAVAIAEDIVAGYYARVSARFRLQ